MLKLGSLISFVVLLGLTVFGQAQQSRAREPAIINKRPMRDLETYARERVENETIDLGAPFSIELTGTLTKDGRLDPATAKYTRSEGDKEMVGLVKRAIEAISTAGYFSYLSELQGKELVLRAEQDGAAFNASVTTTTVSEARARTVVSGLQVMAVVIRNEVESGKRPATDDLRLVQSMTVAAEGKNVILSFKLPKAEFRQMIERSLAK